MNFNKRSLILFFSLLFLAVVFIKNISGIGGESNEENFEKLSDYLYSSPVLKSFRPKFSLDGVRLIDKTKSQNTKLQVVQNNIKPPVVPPAPSVLPSPTPTAIPKKIAKKEEKKEDVIANSGNTLLQNLDTEKNNLDDDSGGGSINTNNQNNGAGGGRGYLNNETISEWLYKLQVSPTKENMNDFVSEFFIKNITSQEFYETLKQLLELNDERTQYIAIYGLAAVPSIKSYELLALKSADKKLYSINIEYAQQVIGIYSQGTYLKILIEALKHPSEDVVIEAIHSIRRMKKTMSVQTTLIADSAGTINLNRVRRGSSQVPSSSQNSKNKVNLSTYKSLINQLHQLTQSRDFLVASSSELLIKEFQQ